MRLQTQVKRVRRNEDRSAFGIIRGTGVDPAGVALSAQRCRQRPAFVENFAGKFRRGGLGGIAALEFFGFLHDADELRAGDCLVGAAGRIDAAIFQGAQRIARAGAEEVHGQAAVDLQDVYQRKGKRAAIGRLVGRGAEVRGEHLARLELLHPSAVIGTVVGAVEIKQQAVKDFVVAGDRPMGHLIPEFAARVRLVVRPTGGKRFLDMYGLTAGGIRIREGQEQRACTSGHPSKMHTSPPRKETAARGFDRPRGSPRRGKTSHNERQKSRHR